jgi:uncharacterized protein
VLIGSIALVRWVEPQLIYFPTREIVQTPTAAGLTFRDLHITTADGVQLHGWFIPTAIEDAPVVLLLHGNGGNISHRLEKIALLRDTGASVCIIDYRGYGKSEGHPSESGLYLDARAAYDYLVNELKTDPRRLVLYGESLGTAVAVHLAADRPVAGVILEAAFTSARTVARELYRFLPIHLAMRSRFDTLSGIPGVKAPLLILHSRSDEFFGIEHAERLLAAAPGPKRLVELRGGHNDAFLVSGETYSAALRDFVGSVAQ